MERRDIVTMLVVAWVVTVFLLYHFQYIQIGQVFLDKYASRYTPWLLDLIKNLLGQVGR